MKRTSALFFILVSLFFTGTALAASTGDKPAVSEQSDYAHTLSSLSKEEQKWFKTFQEGTFLIDGWQSITEELLASTPKNLREHQKKRLDQLGLKIGMEWSKDNDIRRVDTRMLQHWGKTLKKIAKKNPAQLPEVIVSIDRELNNLLN
ncbi:MAG TPA: hypothetical protein ENI88_10855 [Desulfobulbus sp.]|nr:hypothetical protein [Desulfobulbus sp.]